MIMYNSSLYSSLAIIKQHCRYFSNNASSKLFTRHIYCLENSSGVFYVGKTAKPKQRLAMHKYTYGKDIKMTILCSYVAPRIERISQVDHERNWIIKLRNEGHNLINKNKLN